LIEKFTVFSLEKHNVENIIIERSSQIKPPLHPYCRETLHPPANKNIHIYVCVYVWWRRHDFETQGTSIVP
jgi:hypothetical protein